MRAAAVLRGGGLVAFPTETVYGLGGHALDEAAIGRLFAAKGRPAHNPLIVHVAEVGQGRELAADWPEAADRLAARFWPGPLTLVVSKRPALPDAVTGGGPTVALRLPGIRRRWRCCAWQGCPSRHLVANRSSTISPTRADHVLRSLEGRIDLVLDGGPTPGGLESTVVDVTTAPPRLLRPGLVTPTELECSWGRLIEWGRLLRRKGCSPGMLSRHYAPAVPLECVAEEAAAARVAELGRQGLRVGWLTFAPPEREPPEQLRVLMMSKEPAAYAAQLYADTRWKRQEWSGLW